MIYEHRLTISPNTPLLTPAVQLFEVHPGTLNQIGIFFPLGCRGYAHAVIYAQETQIFPTNAGTDFAADGEDLIFPEDLDIPAGATQFYIKGWNLDDTYQHTVTVRMQISPYDKSIVSVLQMIGAYPKVG
jgi:hypothetical protein